MSQSLFEPYKPIAAIAALPTSIKTLQPLCQSMGAVLYSPIETETVKIYHGLLKDHISTIWSEYRAFIFCLATGAVVRLIAPLLAHKSTDPAVIVVDPNGQFVISLCSGHQGGGDKLTQLIAHQLNATAVITSASTGLGLPGIDILGLPFGWRKGSGNWTGVSSAIAQKS